MCFESIAWRLATRFFFLLLLFLWNVGGIRSHDYTNPIPTFNYCNDGEKYYYAVIIIETFQLMMYTIISLVIPSSAYQLILCCLQSLDLKASPINTTVQQLDKEIPVWTVMILDQWSLYPVTMSCHHWKWRDDVDLTYQQESKFTIYLQFQFKVAHFITQQASCCTVKSLSKCIH